MGEDGAHLEFTLDNPVAYTARVAGGSLVIRFEEPQKMDLGRIKSALPELISDVVKSGDGRSIIIGLNFPVTLTHSMQDNVLSLVMTPDRSNMQPGEEPPPPPPPKPAPPPVELDGVRPLLSLRAAQHPEYFRIVFDWRDKTGYQLQASNRGFIIIFERAAEILPAAIKRITPPNCELGEPIIASERTQLTVACAQPINVKDFAKDNLIVVDLYFFPASPSLNTPEPEQPKAAPSPVVEPPKNPEVEKKSPFPESERPIEQPIIPPSEATEPQAVAPEPEKPLPQAASPLPLTKKIQPLIEIAQVKEAFVLKMTWAQPVAAAVFKRAGQIWLVFNQPAQPELQLAQFQGLAPIGETKLIPVTGATVIALETVPGIQPRVLPESDGKTWIITLGNQPMRPNVSIPIDFKTIDARANLSLLVDQPSTVFTVRDPVVGDDIVVGTVQSTARGINGLRSFAQFELLPTAQGAALLPKTPDIMMRQEFDGFFISSTDGLTLAREVTVQKTESGPETFGPNVGRGVADSKPILNYAEWRGDPQSSFYHKELALFAELASLDEKLRNPKRLELAKLYFAHGWMSETLAVLDAAAIDDSSFNRQPEAQAMRGVAELNAFNFKAAREHLMDLRFDTQPDLATWRAVLAVQSNDWLGSGQYFSVSDHPNPDAPANLRKLAYLARIESEINNNNLLAAQEMVATARQDNGLPKMDQILDYWQGELTLRDGRTEEAVEIWNKVVASEDPYARPRAELALINYGATSQTVERQELIARLERLRFSWRGDRFEFAVLKMLGEMQIQDGLYRDGLYNLRRAVTNYADQPYAEELSKLMVVTFQKLFLEGSVDKMSPVGALALFDEFRDLTPTGPEGDKIIQKLVERLISVDLLDRAADLLSHQVNYRLQGEEKARIGAKLALVYLLDRKPEEAIKAIESSNAAQVSAPLQAERRLLRARALFDLNRSNEALTLIADIDGREADMLRADLYWRLRNWQGAITQLQKLLAQVRDATVSAEEKAVDPEVSRLVISLALANALAGNDQALRDIKKEYWASMKTSPDFEVFEIITAVDASQPLSITELGSKLDAVSRLESFMTYYREQIKKGKFISDGQ
jgi:tetratricopeptide (TPR) repeat protein